MGEQDHRPRPLDPEPDASSARASAGVDRETTLLDRTYEHLTRVGRSTFEPSADFFDALESAYLQAYLVTYEQAAVTPRLQTAMDDARVFTAEDFADRPGADLRAAVISTFHDYVVGFHRAAY